MLRTFRWGRKRELNERGRQEAHEGIWVLVWIPAIFNRELTLSYRLARSRIAIFCQKWTEPDSKFYFISIHSSSPSAAAATTAKHSSTSRIFACLGGQHVRAGQKAQMTEPCLLNSKGCYQYNIDGGSGDGSAFLDMFDGYQEADFMQTYPWMNVAGPTH